MSAGTCLLEGSNRYLPPFGSFSLLLLTPSFVIVYVVGGEGYGREGDEVVRGQYGYSVTHQKSQRVLLNSYVA